MSTRCCDGTVLENQGISKLSPSGLNGKPFDQGDTTFLNEICVLSSKTCQMNIPFMFLWASSHEDISTNTKFLKTHYGSLEVQFNQPRTPCWTKQERWPPFLFLANESKKLLRHKNPDTKPLAQQTPYWWAFLPQGMRIAIRGSGCSLVYCKVRFFFPKLDMNQEPHTRPPLTRVRLFSTQGKTISNITVSREENIREFLLSRAVLSHPVRDRMPIMDVNK